MLVQQRSLLLFFFQLPLNLLELVVQDCHPLCCSGQLSTFLLTFLLHQNTLMSSKMLHQAWASHVGHADTQHSDTNIFNGQMGHELYRLQIITVLLRKLFAKHTPSCSVAHLPYHPA